MSANKRPPAPAAPGSFPRTGKIFIDGDSTGFSITLQKVSPGGAQLRQVFPFPVPGNFSLVTFNRVTNRDDARSCEKIWQRGDLVNVRFL